MSDKEEGVAPPPAVIPTLCDDNAYTQSDAQQMRDGITKTLPIYNATSPSSAMVAATPISSEDADTLPIAIALPTVTIQEPLVTSTSLLASTIQASLQLSASTVKANGASKTNSAPNNEHMNRLREQGFPAGLASEMENVKNLYPTRIWIVDNSGSMRLDDGHPWPSEYTSSQNGGSDRARRALVSSRSAKITRWKELQDSVEYHARLGECLHAPSIFRFLNDPGPQVAPSEVALLPSYSAQRLDNRLSVDDHKILLNNKAPLTLTIPEQSQVLTQSQMDSSYHEAVDNFCKVLQKAEAKGVTPLTHHIQVIHRHLEEFQSALLQNGQQVVLVIATDGLPSNNQGESPLSIKTEFAQALKALQSLPVWIVIRLCTDDKDVVEYYNQFDAQLELPLEVLDDLVSEAMEIRAVNPWLNYAGPLHRCREMGYHHRVMDLLDERLLTIDELKDFLVLLFGSTIENAPNPRYDWNGFSQVVSRTVKAEGQLYNPATGKLDHWINLRVLDRLYSPKRRWFGRR
jgi:hypothetical protein